MKRAFFVIAVFLPLLMFGQIGPDVSVDKDGNPLKWEEGSRDYFVMFKSLLLNNNRTECTPGLGTTCNLGDDQPGNPQADACVDEATGTTFTLEASHIPQDAHVIRAFLIWTGATPDGQFDQPADNTVHLKFTNADNSITVEKDVVADAHHLTDPKTFEFEGLDLANIAKNGLGQPFKACTSDTDCTDDPQMGEGWQCLQSAEFGGKYCGQRNGIFTYRVDITDFFDEIHKKSNDAGNRFDGLGLLGDYNVSGLTCVASPSYVATSGLVGGWTILFVYTSEEISPKKIYIYNGFINYQFKEQDINVQGFTLPDEAELRLTLHVLEGDPGLVSTTQPTPAETLMLSGASTQDWLPLFNDCNPPMNGYTEMYNSISSMYGWNDDTVSCIGDYSNKDSLEYAMDVDTIILNAKDAPFNDHLKKGDHNFWLKISANQDQIYTNYLVLSVDTKAPKFDIPNAREKDVCTCSTEPDSICFDRPFLYTINIQNWGEQKAFGVTLQDTLPSEVTYIPGTTEKRVTKDGKTGAWEKVPDASGGGFPFATAAPIADELYYCDKSSNTCQDSVMVRFKVKPKSGLPKQAVISNTAFISDNTGVAYQSNTSVPLRLREGNCPPISDCPEPPLSECGGNAVECSKNEDCGDGEVCKDGQCVLDESMLSETLSFSWQAGAKSGNVSNKVYIPSPSEKVVTGQLEIRGDGDEDKKYRLKSLTVSFHQGDSDVNLTNVTLLLDSNNDGKVDKGDITLASTDEAAYGKNVTFSILDQQKSLFDTNKTYNLLLVTDAEYTGDHIGKTAKFNASISGAEAFSLTAAGKINTSGSSVTFPTFAFEPTEGAFIVTAGDAVTSSAKASVIPLVALRTKTVSGGDTLAKIDIQVMRGSLSFGEGITSLKLFVDTDNNGELSSSDTLVESIDTFALSTRASFTALNSLTYPNKGDEKQLIIAFSASVNADQFVQLKVSSASLKSGSKSGSNIVGLPIVTEKYTTGGASSGSGTETGGDTDEGGCTALTVY